jgi:branched-chain amino acid transport system substrate-binding protein
MRRRLVFLMKCVGLIGLAFSLLLVVEGKPSGAAEPIKIGVVLSLTGRGGFIGTPEKEAITIVAGEVNRRGGVLGRQLEVYFEDDQSNPTNSAVAATKLIRDKKVCCVIGSSLTVGCMAIIPICEREEVLQLVPTPVTDPFRKWVFKPVLTDYRVAQMMLQFTVETLGARKIALLHSTDAHGMGGAKGVTENSDRYGASIAITENFEPADTSIIPQLTKIKAARPDAILLYANAAPAAVVAKNYHQLGMETTVIGSQGIPSPEFVRLAGKIAEESRWITFSVKSIYAERLPPDDPFRKNLFDPFMKALKEEYGKTEYATFHANGHDSMRILVGALKIAGTDDRVALRDALEKVKVQGLLCDFAFSPTDHDGNTRGESYVPLILKDGKWGPYKK